jgi:hypothetical protein
MSPSIIAAFARNSNSACKHPLRVMAIEPSGRHTNDAAKNFSEVTLVGKAGTYRSLKNSNFRIIK